MANSRKIRISGPAGRDLERIGDYTRREWGEAQKRVYLGEIREALKRLRDMPGTGVARDDIDEGLRAHPIRKHIIFFRDTEDALTIVRVLHASMDVKTRLRRD